MLWSLLSGACRPVQPEAVGPAFQEAADRIIDGPGWHLVFFPQQCLTSRIHLDGDLD